MCFDPDPYWFKSYLPSWNYTFMHLGSLDWYQLPVLAKTLDEAEDNAKVYVFWQNDAHGQEYLAAAAQYFPAQGLQIVGNASVLDPAPYDTLVQGASTTGADVVCCFCYPDEVIGLTLAAITNDYNFDAWVVDPTASFGWFGTTPPIGDNATGVTCFAMANNKTSEDMEWLLDDVLVSELGYENIDLYTYALFWAALQVWQEAVEETGHILSGEFVVDQNDFRAKLASYTSSATGVDTVLGKTWYEIFGTGGGLLDYQCHTGEIGQWQDGMVEVVGYTGITGDIPNYVVTANFTYPKPPWQS
ncbi:MAG: ABC transporter substrate-binding protein [Chloroflexi bacterium]|nr:ABC transporter substrate-binding protein [Chloroflexota bacterium]